MWSKKQIHALKTEAYPFLENDYILEHFRALNFLFDRYVMEKNIRKEERLWWAVEAEADLVMAKLTLLDVEMESV